MPPHLTSNGCPGIVGTMTKHTLEIIAHDWSDWTNYPGLTYSVTCSCGIASGMSHRTETDARNEYPHLIHLDGSRGIARVAN